MLLYETHDQASQACPSLQTPNLEMTLLFASPGISSSQAHLSLLTNSSYIHLLPAKPLPDWTSAHTLSPLHLLDLPVPEQSLQKEKNEQTLFCSKPRLDIRCFPYPSLFGPHGPLAECCPLCFTDEENKDQKG